MTQRLCTTLNCPRRATKKVKVYACDEHGKLWESYAEVKPIEKATEGVSELR